MTTNPIETKIQALLNTANHPGTPIHEAETAMAMATKLMVKYAIDEKMLGPNAQPDEIIAKTIKVDGQYANVRRNLLYGIGLAWGLKGVSSGRTGITFVGTAEGIATTERLFASIDIQMANEATSSRPQWAQNGAQVVSWRTNFQKGYISKVSARLREQRRNAVAEARTEHGPGVGIMLADVDARTAAKFKEMFPRTTTRRSYAGAGYGQGQTAGNNANIGNRQIAGRAAIGR
jgi:hypothetical protein